MKKFEFKLDKVLKVRQIEKELAENRLMEANQKVRESEQEISFLEDKQENLYQFIREENLTVGQHIQTRNYLNNQRQKINQTEDKLTEYREEVVQCQQEYINKKQKEEMMEKLKDKAYQRYNKKLLLKEQKVLDELGQRSEGLQGV